MLSNTSYTRVLGALDLVSDGILIAEAMEILPKLAKGFKPWPTSLKGFILDIPYGFERVSE